VPPQIALQTTTGDSMAAADTSGKLGLAALATGVILLLLGIAEVLSDWRFFQSATSVEGIVWFTSSSADDGGRGVRVRIPVAQEETEIWVLPYHFPKTANATVTVAWPEGREEEARINSLGERLVVPLLFFIFGLPLLWVSRWLRDDSLPDWAEENLHNIQPAGDQAVMDDSNTDDPDK